MDGTARIIMSGIQQHPSIEQRSPTFPPPGTLFRQNTNVSNCYLAHASFAEVLVTWPDPKRPPRADLYTSPAHNTYLTKYLINRGSLPKSHEAIPHDAPRNHASVCFSHLPSQFQRAPVPSLSPINRTIASHPPLVFTSCASPAPPSLFARPPVAPSTRCLLAARTPPPTKRPPIATPPCGRCT